MYEGWKPVGFKDFDSVPLHWRPLRSSDPEVVTVRNSDTMYFHKPSTDQYWIQIGFVEDEHGEKSCPTDRCKAQCCRVGTPYPKSFGITGDTCIFLDKLKCGIQSMKFLCCSDAPEPWNSMENYNLCEIRCVEVQRV